MLRPLRLWLGTYGKWLKHPIKLFARIFDHWISM